MRLVLALAASLTLAPTRQFAVRNRVFKLVEMTRLDWSGRAPVVRTSLTDRLTRSRPRTS